MAQPAGSILPSDFGYCVSTDHSYDYQREGEFLYVSFPLPLMPKHWQSGALREERRQKVTLTRQIENLVATKKFTQRFCLDGTFGWGMTPGSVTQPFYYDQTGIQNHDWQAEDDSVNDMDGSLFIGHQFGGNADYNPRLCEGVINLTVETGQVAVIDGIFIQMKNDELYDGESYEEQPRKAAVSAGRRYDKYDAATAYEIMKRVSESVNRMAYAATTWSTSVPFYGGYQPA